MTYSWMYDDFAALRPFKAAADILQRKSDWPELYDVEELSRNRVPVAAATYYDDMCDALSWINLLAISAGT